MSIRIWLCTTVAACALATSSCASITVNAFPQPGNAYRDGYDVIVEFVNVLNLPDRAKVVLEGTTVGVVTKMTTESQRVDVTLRIDRNVSLPSDIHAELQQATVLGDTYVALERPTNDATSVSTLNAGDRIGVASTTSPPQVEDTIVSIADFVSSGSIQRMQNTVIGINRVQPEGEGAIRKVASQVAEDLSGLSANMDLVDQWVKGVSGTAAVMHDRIPDFETMFSQKGMTGYYRMFRILWYVGSILPSLGSIYSNGYWLGPLLDSLGDAMGAVQHSKWSFEDEWPAWRRLFTDYFLAQDKYPAINITSIIGPDGQEMSDKVGDVLRIIGAMP